MTTPNLRQSTLSSLVDDVLSKSRAHPIRLGVSGITASGKSTLAREIVEEIERRGRSCIRTSIDHFHNPKVIRYWQGRASALGYFQDAHDYAAIRDLLLAPLGPGGNLTYRTGSLDLETDRALDGPPQIAANATILVVDGTFLFKDELFELWDYKVFVDTSFPVAMERGVQRSINDVPRSEMEDLFRLRYHAASKMYLDACRPRDRADAVWQNDDLANPSLRLR